VYKTGKDFALEMDSKDPLKDFRNRFYIPENTIYLCGNSLGLQPRHTKDYIEQELEDWKRLGVEGHTQAKRPWLPYHEFLTESTARLTGADFEEVVNMNSLTTNLHLMMISFYRPSGKRKKILIEKNAFPSDIYAVKSQIELHGYNVKDTLIEYKAEEGEDIIKTSNLTDYIEKYGDEIALIMIGGVNYYTGQAFDMESITKVGHKKGCIVAFDLAHAMGNIKLDLSKWGVDFAVWCNYKYMNAGPGAIGGAYVNKKHLKDEKIPKLKGWWGHNKEIRFLMGPDFEAIPTVESWQLSNPPIFQLAALRASLDIFDEAGMERLRQKSEKLTGYCEYLIKNSIDNNIEIITPPNPDDRGCQLSLRTFNNGKQIHTRLTEAGVICDWREPDVIRIAPVPLYNTFEDVFNFTEILLG